MSETFAINLNTIKKMAIATKELRAKVLRSWTAYMLRVTRERYRSQTAPDGSRWKETVWRPTDIKSERTNKQGIKQQVFSDFTGMKRSKKGNLTKTKMFSDRRWVRTLYGRGDLFRSIVSFTTGNPNVVGIGSNLIYAKTMQEGARFTATTKQSFFLFLNVFSRQSTERRFSWHYHITIPARPFLGFSDDDKNKLGDIAETHLTGL